MRIVVANDVTGRMNCTPHCTYKLWNSTQKNRAKFSKYVLDVSFGKANGNDFSAGHGIGHRRMILFGLSGFQPAECVCARNGFYGLSCSFSHQRSCSFTHYIADVSPDDTFKKYLEA